MDQSFADALAAHLSRLRAAPAEPASLSPETSVEWVLSLDLGGPLPLGRVQSRVTPAWLTERGRPTAYARDTEGALGFLYSSDAPDPITGLALAWRIRPLDPRERLDGAALLDATRALAVELGATLGEPSLPVAALGARRRELDALERRCAHTVELALMAPDGGRFSGVDVLAAFQELGLEHGDMDMFHVHDPSGDSLLGVSPIDDYEWFEPRALATDQQRPQGLLISFSVPRTRTPVRVAELAGLLAVELRGRLGGEITDLATGMLAEGVSLRHRVRACVKELNAAGFPPGRRAALMLF